MRRSYRYGYFLVASSAILWATNGVFVKDVYKSSISPFFLIFARSFLSFLSFFIICEIFYKRRREEIGTLPLMFISVFGLASVQIFYLLAIKELNVGVAVVLQYTSPTIVALASVWVFGERITLHLIISLFLTTSGVFLIASPSVGKEVEVLGILFGILAAFSLAFYTMYGKIMLKDKNPIFILKDAFFVNSVLWLPFLFKYLPSNFNIEILLKLFYIGTLGTALPFFLFFLGLSLIKAHIASIISTLEPVAGAIFAYIFLGETLSIKKIFGGILIILSIIYLNLFSEGISEKDLKSG